MVTQLIRFIFLAMLLPTTAYAGFPSGSYHRPHAQVIFNAITLGATCNGSGNDDPAFFAAGNTMRADARVVAGADVVLYIPPGSSCIFGSCSGSYWHALNNFTLVMTGVTMTSFGGCLRLLSGGIDFASYPGGDGSGGQMQAPIATVAAGSSCVTTLTHADAGTAAYTPGKWAIPNGIGLQGNSFPPNYGVFEFVKITSQNGSTGVVCFTTPLANGYKSTWIINDAQGCSGVSCGGAARLVPLNISWGFTTTIIGGQWNWDQSAEFGTQNVVMNNTVWNGLGTSAHTCFIPSFNQNVTFNNSTIQNCSAEVDKEIGNWTINGGSISRLEIQSSSMVNVILNNTSVGFMNAAQNTFCNNSTLGIGFGNSFGNAVSFVGNNCTISSTPSFVFNNTGACDGTGCASQFLYTGSGNFEYGENDSGTPPPPYHSGAPAPFYTPGTPMLFGKSSTRYTGFPFTITDNTCSPVANPCFVPSTGVFATNSALASPLTSSLPPQDDTTTAHTIVPDLMHNWSCSNCTGSAFAIDASQAPAQNAALFTYTSRTFTCTANVPNIPNSLDINSTAAGSGPGPVIGTVSSMSFNVTRADTSGGHSAGSNTMSYGGFFRTVDQVTGTVQFLTEFVDLDVAGNRTVVPTVTGAQPHDSLTAPGGTPFQMGDGTPANGWSMNLNLSGESASTCPIVTFTEQATR